MAKSAYAVPFMLQHFVTSCGHRPGFEPHVSVRSFVSGALSGSL